MKIHALVLCGLFAGLSLPVLAADKAVERGRYLVRTSGCNDCHTPGFMENDGATPERQWMSGSAIGFSGPWGTTYPSNLRLLAQMMTEQQWLARARSPMRPPMPTPSLRAMRDDDLRAIYRYIRSLGAVGEAAPAYVPPGRTVRTPYFDFVPKNLPQQANK